MADVSGIAPNYPSGLITVDIDNDELGLHEVVMKEWRPQKEGDDVSSASVPSLAEGKFRLVFDAPPSTAEKGFEARFKWKDRPKGNSFKKFWAKRKKYLMRRYRRSWFVARQKTFKLKARQMWEAQSKPPADGGESGHWEVRRIPGSFIKQIWRLRDGDIQRAPRAPSDSAYTGYKTIVPWAGVVKSRLYLRLFDGSEDGEIRDSDSVRYRLGLNGASLTKGRFAVLPRAAAFAIEEKWSDTPGDVKKVLDDLRQWQQKTYKVAIKRPLLPVQDEALQFLISRGNAFLAMDVGTGKTSVGLAYARYLLDEKLIDRVIVFAGGSELIEWSEEARDVLGKKFTHREFDVVRGPKETRHHKWRSSHRKFMLATYDSTRSDEKVITNFLKRNRTLILADEATSIKNRTAARTQVFLRFTDAAFKITLSGTPLENRVTELYTLEEFLGTCAFGTLADFRRMYGRKGSWGRSKRIELRERLKETIMFRRLLSDVWAENPGVEVQEVLVDLEGDALADYNKIAASVEESIEELEELKQQYAQARMMGDNTRMALLRQRVSTARTNVLALMQISMGFCNHPLMLKRSTSPVARRAYESFAAPKLTPKLNALMDFIVSKVPREEKFLVFTRNPLVARIIRLRLEREFPEKRFTSITGDMKVEERWQARREFKTGRYWGLIMNDVGQRGLNLQNANWVLNLDLPWNPAKLLQRQGRALRYGQTKKVQVVNFIVSNADLVEAKILSVNERKIILIDELIDDQQAQSVKEYLENRFQRAIARGFGTGRSPASDDVRP